MSDNTTIFNFKLKAAKIINDETMQYFLSNREALCEHNPDPKIRSALGHVFYKGAETFANELIERLVYTKEKLPDHAQEKIGIETAIQIIKEYGS